METSSGSSEVPAKYSTFPGASADKSSDSSGSSKEVKVQPSVKYSIKASKTYQVQYHGPEGGASKCPGCNQQLPYPWHLPHLHEADVSVRGGHKTSAQRDSMGEVQQMTKIPLHPNLLLDSSAVGPGHSFIGKQSVKSRTGTYADITSEVSLTTGVGLFRDMAEEIPMFPKATSMYIHSGNIVNWNRLKRKPNQNSTDEVCECIGQTLGSYLESADKTKLQYVMQLYKVNTENIQVLGEEEREEVKITVKVFVCAPQPSSVIKEAVGKVLNELGTNYVETLLLSVSPNTGEEEESDQSQVNLSTIKPYWEEMEELVSTGKVLTLGVCDLNKDNFEDLYNWAQVKPCIDQVNLESCCVMPKELTEFAKSVNVQLLTHNDRPVFITKERLQETIQSISTERDSDAWTPQWAVRYSGIMKCRGIIKMKGYIFHALRDNKKRLL